VASGAGYSNLVEKVILERSLILLCDSAGRAAAVGVIGPNDRSAAFSPLTVVQ